ATTAKAVAVNPQFAGSTSEGESIDVDSRLNSEELLAAAPLGSEVYAPVIENPAGRIVTPEMPVMPDQEVYLPESPNRFDGYMWPTQGVLTSGYGWRWGRMHRGVDIAGPVGTPIYAAGAGVVVTSGWNSGGYGNMVDIRHPDGSLTRYAHNSRLMVSPGQQVRQGQQIAEMGSTGYSTGPHLHFEIHIPNQGTVNPIALLPGR
ncbi:MAG: M23 family metallopeptidase, partial [Cyanobacteria bacterium P01_D01_bin.71]